MVQSHPVATAISPHHPSLGPLQLSSGPTAWRKSAPLKAIRTRHTWAPRPKPPLKAGAGEPLPLCGLGPAPPALAGPPLCSLLLLCPPCNGCSASTFTLTNSHPDTALPGLESPIKIAALLVSITQSQTKPPQQAWIPSPGLPPPSPASTRQPSALGAFLAHLGLGHPSPPTHTAGGGGAPRAPSRRAGQDRTGAPGEGSLLTRTSQAGGSEVAGNWDQARDETVQGW
ncbi:hypothetical protein GH733_010035, partial [Mirounga leonina]